VVARPQPRGRATYRIFRNITLRWADNDAYGHVNNTVYYEWFDSAVNQWLVEQGLLNISDGGPIGLVVETGCRYFAPLAFPGEAEVGLAVAAVGGSSITYHLGIFDPDADAPAAEGHFVHVLVDRMTRRPTPVPENWRAALALLR